MICLQNHYFFDVPFLFVTPQYRILILNIIFAIDKILNKTSAFLLKIQESVFRQTRKTRYPTAVCLSEIKSGFF